MKVYLDAYLQRNFGDDLFLHILLNRYHHHDFYTLCRDKTYTNTYPNLHVYSREFIVRVIKKLQIESLCASRCDVTLTLGGSMFIEDKYTINKNYSLGKNDHYVLGVNFGPCVSDAYFHKIRSHLERCKDVCFRDEYSYSLFKDMKHVRKASDIIFSLPLDDIEVKEEKRVLFSIISCKNKMDEKYHEAYKLKMIELINHFRNQGYSITLMSFCKFEGDEEAITDIMDTLDDRDYIDTYFYDGNIQEALNMIASSKIIVGSRFHAVILGLLLNKATIPVVYSDKTMHVLHDLGYHSLIIDIKHIDQFHIEAIDEDVLDYRLDVSQAISDAHNHFMKLDGVLK